MAKTLIARLKKLEQYDENTATIIWQNTIAGRWAEIYSKLEEGDTALFLSNGNLLIGDYSGATPEVSIQIKNVRKIALEGDDFLRLNTAYPEKLSRVKGAFQPFLSPVPIDVNLIFQEATDNQLISFFIVKEGSLESIKTHVKKNDRVISLNNQNVFIDFFLYDGLNLNSYNTGVGLFNIRNKNLQEILQIHIAVIKKDAKRDSNNVTSVNKIIKTLSIEDYYKFRSFSEYYNIVHNKKLYLNLTDSEEDETDDLPDDVEDYFHKSNMPLNSILFGPPGTGKTFHSITHAVAIVENKTLEAIGAEDRINVKIRFDRYIREGQIVFCTFHQSMGYEDFIEGIKPVEPTSENEELTYAVQDGIFKKLCVEAAFSFVQQKPAEERKEIVDFSTHYDLYINSLKERLSKNESIELATIRDKKIIVKSIVKNTIYFIHEEGIGRSSALTKSTLFKFLQAFPNLEEVKKISKQFRTVAGGDNTAHWAILNDFREYKSKHDSKTVQEITDKDFPYEEEKEIIEVLTEEDYKVENSKSFVIIIDEINRGNVSQIFGELITLIEDDKRLGKDESLTALLPYSKKRFGVPPNVYIIGTMNTADRSVEALDTALRRRFAFIPKMPEETKLQQTEDGINLVSMLTSINNRLKVLKDADHTIGHAWLWNVKTVEDLQTVFGNKILPLLQEYFYNDFEKLGLVLGDNFFEKPRSK